MADALSYERGERSTSLEIASHPAMRDLIADPLPHLGLLDRCLLRTVLRMSRGCVHSFSGLQHIAHRRDPFILALNHSTKLEALIVPAILLAARGGQLLPFLADWNFRLIPCLGLLYQRAGVINVTRKPAKPKILNVLRPLYVREQAAWQQAEQLLLAGTSVALFVEGTVNRDPNRLLKGRIGAAYLSYRTGAPVVPAGLTFPAVAAGSRVPEGSPIALNIAPPLQLPRSAKIKTRHAEIMNAITLLSGKSWNPNVGE